MAKRYSPISRYLVYFVLLALLPGAVTAYLSLSQAQRIEAQADRQNQKKIESEFLAALAKVEQRARRIARNLAAWDETVLNFSDPTYYQYWKETRARDAGILDNAVDSVELYRSDGRSLAGDGHLAEPLLRHPQHCRVVLKSSAPFLDCISPVRFSQVPSADAPANGYVKVTVSLRAALAAQGMLAAGGKKTLQWEMGSDASVPLDRILERVTLRAERSPEINALATLVQRSFVEFLLFSVILLATVAVLLTTTLGRPLQRMAAHIRNMHHGAAEEIPESVQTVFKIQELEQVRCAVNEYRNNFHRAKDSLIEKNLELEQLTYRDVLTGVFNRRAFESHLRQALDSAKNEGTTHALCYMDLDQFKVVNDTCGHVAGDELLRQIAACLQLSLREADILARLGGDEFGVLLTGCSVGKAQEVAESMRQAVKTLRFVWEDKVFDVAVSIGVVAISGEAAGLSDVLKAADAACYMAKDRGRNRVHLYQHDDEGLAQLYGEMQWVSKITQALDEGRFVLYGQRVAPLSRDDGTGSYFEVLVRMRDEDGELVPPMAFLPAAERYNLIGDLDRWVVTSACKALKRHRRYFESWSTGVAVNISGQSLGDDAFLQFVLDLLVETGIDPKLLCFELTETAAITHLVSAKHFIDVLREKGCRFALDDFGSGLSSFAYLKNLPVDCLKIDGHFIKHIVDDPVDRAMVSSINQVGHLMGMSTVAEFVENEAVVAVLKEIGVDYAQGYGIAKPEPLDEVLERADGTDERLCVGSSALPLG